MNVSVSTCSSQWRLRLPEYKVQLCLAVSFFNFPQDQYVSVHLRDISSPHTVSIRTQQLQPVEPGADDSEVRLRNRK